MAKESFLDRAINEWWGKVAAGVVIIGGALLLIYQIGQIESGDRESMRVNALVKFAYEIGGRWTIGIILILFGAAMAAWGAVQAVRGRE